MQIVQKVCNQYGMLSSNTLTGSKLICLGSVLTTPTWLSHADGMVYEYLGGS